MNDAELLAAIEHCFPSVRVESWRLLGEGWMSRALLVNERYVFRFPRHAEAAADLAKEAALLPVIASAVSLPVPRFELHGEQSNGLPFVGYRLLEGEPFEPGTWVSLDGVAQARVVGQLATFMNELHGVPLEIARQAGLCATDHRREYAEDREALRAFAAQLPARVAAYVEHRFESFLSNDAFFANEARLIHADLSPEHLLFDPAAHELTGIIDFGDLSVADPDYEYLYLLEDLGRELTTRVMLARGESDFATLLDKVGHYVTFDHVHSILGGQQHGMQAWIDEGVAALTAEAGA